MIFIISKHSESFSSLWFYREEKAGPIKALIVATQNEIVGDM